MSAASCSCRRVERCSGTRHVAGRRDPPPLRSITRSSVVKWRSALPVHVPGAVWDRARRAPSIEPGRPAAGAHRRSGCRPRRSWRRKPTGDPITVWGDGSIVRDYIDITDLATLCVRAGTSSAVGVFNAGNGVGRSIRDVVSTIETVTGRTARRALPARSVIRRAEDRPRQRPRPANVRMVTGDRFRRERPPPVGLDGRRPMNASAPGQPFAGRSRRGRPNKPRRKTPANTRPAIGSARAPPRTARTSNPTKNASNARPRNRQRPERDDPAEDRHHIASSRRQLTTQPVATRDESPNDPQPRDERKVERERDHDRDRHRSSALLTDARHWSVRRRG